MKETGITVKIVGVQLTDKYEGQVQFKTNTGNAYEACFWGLKFKVGEVRIIELSQFGIATSWESIFSLNRNQEKRLEKGLNPCEYNGYGQIEKINPVIANFGDIKLNLGDWTNDERVIGEYIYWKVSQLAVAIGISG